MTAASSQIVSSKFLPCLLARLTDEHPFSTADEGYGSFFSLERLKKDVMTNLSMLLNSHVAPAETVRLRRKFPLAAASGYHFGIDSYAGLFDLSENLEHMAESVRQAIILFEPRFLPSSVDVSIDTRGGKRDKTTLDLSISCVLAVHPLSEDMFFRLQVDLETGEISLNP